MKRTFFFHPAHRFISPVARWGAIAAVALLACAAAPLASSQTTLLTYFNFNDAGPNSNQAAAAAFTSDSTAVPAPLQVTTLTTNYTATDILSALGSSVNVAPGDPITAASNAGNHSLSFVSPANNSGSFIQFTASTTGFQDLALTLAVRSTTQGFQTLTLSYSTDGTNFTTDGTFTSARNSTFELATFDLSAITAVDNQASVTFRITFSNPGTNSGTTNLDNIQLNGIPMTPVPEPATVVGGLLATAGLCWHQRRRFKAFACSLVA